jgi:hypothetical protein
MSRSAARKATDKLDPIFARADLATIPLAVEREVNNEVALDSLPTVNYAKGWD